jgi:hypothetical protein
VDNYGVFIKPPPFELLCGIQNARPPAFSAVANEASFSIPPSPFQNDQAALDDFELPKMIDLRPTSTPSADKKQCFG